MSVSLAMSCNPHENPEFLLRVIEELPVGLCLLDRERRIQFWNHGAERIAGYLAQEVIGRACAEHLVEICDRDAEAGCAAPPLEMLFHGQPQEWTALFLHKLGHRVPVNIRSQSIMQNDGIVGAIIVFEESAAGQQESASSMYGRLDSSTGVPSPRLTRAVLRESMETMNETGRGFGLLRIRVLGLDEFRSRHGAHSSTPFMRAAAQTLRHNLQAGDFLGRWGEDEFIAVFESTNPLYIRAVAETLWHAIGQSEVGWWGDHFQVQAVLMHTVAQPGDQLDKLLNGLEPAHAAAAGHAIGEITDRPPQLVQE